MNDSINSPKHYTFGKFEVIDVIEDWHLGFHLGNTVKYIARAKHKGYQLEDLKKARWYLEREIKRLERKQSLDELRTELVSQGGYRSGRKIIEDSHEKR
jgi:hypothetical protein